MTSTMDAIGFEEFHGMVLSEYLWRQPAGMGEIDEDHFRRLCRSKWTGLSKKLRRIFFDAAVRRSLELEKERLTKRFVRLVAKTYHTRLA